jgi:hypothetical protein
MATSPIYGWAEPDDTSLVKNGALAMRTLGNAIDTTMATMVPKSIVDAKGDLIGATANDTPARLAVGTNGQVLTADSTAATGLAWATPSGGTNSFYAGKNKIINADFGIWQRGTSFNPSATGFFFFADRWRSYTYSASATTASQQTFTAGTAPVAGYEGTYFGRVVSTNTFAYFSYNGIENVRTFAGQTVTLSYWAKSASAQTLNEVQVSQYFGSTGSTAVATTLTAPSITTSWVRYTHTFAMPSISGKTIGGGNDGIFINIKGAINNALDMWGFQLEAGSTATDFVTASGGSPQAELAMCQRYFNRFNGGVSLYYANGMSDSATTAYGVYSYPVTMRVVPSFATVGAASNFSLYNAGGAITCSAVPGFTNAGVASAVIINTVASGMTAGRAVMLTAGSSTALDFSAEL